VSSSAFAVDSELCAVDEARAIGREKNNCFGNLLGLGRTPGRPLSGQLLKTFAKQIRAFGARVRTYRIHFEWTYSGIAGRPAVRKDRARERAGPAGLAGQVAATRTG
jgi:hypothetical protein